LKACIFSSVFATWQGCYDAIQFSLSSRESVLKPNFREILRAAKPKLVRNGILIYIGYATYFDDKSTDCDHQDWSFPVADIFYSSPNVNTKQRTQFNDLVILANRAIKEVVDEMNKSEWGGNAVFVEWDDWVAQEGGGFCLPGASGDPEDPSNANVLFFKFSTAEAQRELKRRSLGYGITEIGLYRNRSGQTDGPNVLSKGFDVIQRSLGVPVKPHCPGSDKTWVDKVLGGVLGGLPDFIGKVFHPNEKGHEVVASFALSAIMQRSVEQLGVKDPLCGFDSRTTWTCNRVAGD
jgi:hypothetical protein